MFGKVRMRLERGVEERTVRGKKNSWSAALIQKYNGTWFTPNLNNVC